MAQPLRHPLVREAAIAAIAATATFAALTGGAPPAQAQAPAAPYYQALLAEPVAAPRVEIVGGVAWACAAERCTAAKGTSRPEVVCGRLSRKLGAVSSFSAGGSELEPGRLGKCNREEPAAVLTRNAGDTTARP